jgi:hypothetical protein
MATCAPGAKPGSPRSVDPVIRPSRAHGWPALLGVAALLVAVYGGVAQAQSQ